MAYAKTKTNCFIPLFGIPIFKTKIISKNYDKNIIINTIKKNYEISSVRTTTEFNDNLHHSYNDFDNEKFYKVDFSSLIPLYHLEISKFISATFNKEVKVSFEIINYTCMTKNQFMSKHNHGDADFTGIHYVKFNKNHSQTMYYNPSGFCDYMNLMPFFKIKTKTNTTTSLNSYLTSEFSLNCNEDDFIISPSILLHSVPPSIIDDLRITVVVNIKIHN